MNGKRFLSWILIMTMIMLYVPVSFAEDIVTDNGPDTVVEDGKVENDPIGTNNANENNDGNGTTGNQGQGKGNVGDDVATNDQPQSDKPGSKDPSDPIGSNNANDNNNGKGTDGNEGNGKGNGDNDEDGTDTPNETPDDIYTLYITVDDYHTIYVNGQELTNPDNDWKTVDTHVVDVTDLDDLVVAVRGTDRTIVDGKGTATIAGFLMTVERTYFVDGQMAKSYSHNTNDSWQQNLTIPSGDETEWYKPGYEAYGWSDATEIAESDIDEVGWNGNVTASEFPYESGAKWIWSADYNGNSFESPVYFRNVIELPENDPPVARDDAAEADINSVVTVDVLANDTDSTPDEVLMIKSVGESDHATLEIDGDQIVVTPDKNFFGEVSFEYTVVDSSDAEDTAVVVIDYVADFSDLFKTGTADTEGAVEHNVSNAIILADMQTENDTDVVSNLRIKNVTDSTFEYEEEVAAGQNAEDAIGYLAIQEGLLMDEDGKVVGEAGKITIDYNDKNGESDLTNDSKSPDWFQLNNVYEFDNPIVIAMMNTMDGKNYTHVRVDASDDENLMVWLEEWSNHRKTNHHVPEEVAFLILEEGIHTINGYVFEAQSVTATEAFVEYEFETYFNNAPLVLGQPQDYIDEGITTRTNWGTDQATLRIKNVYSDSVELKVLEDIKASGSFVNDANAFVAIGKKGNRPPVAAVDEVTTNEDEDITIDAASNDTDADGDDLKVSGVGQPMTEVDGTQVATGSAEVVDGKVDFKPADNFHGTVTISYTVTDGEDEAVSTITVTVTPVNDAPVAVDDEKTTEEDQEITFDISDLIDNDEDVDQDTLYVVSVDNAVNGQAILDTVEGTITFTPDHDFNGQASFEYTVFDGELSDIGLVVVDVEAVNDAPKAQADSAETSEDLPTTIDVLDNDSDVDGDSLNVIIETQPENGSVKVNEDNTVTYTPNDNFNGDDEFSYKVIDPSGLMSDVVTVSVTVGPVIDELKAIDDESKVNEDETVVIPVQANDENFDNLDVIVDIVTEPEHGTVIVNEDGTVTYEPEDDFNGNDAFEYRLVYGSGDDIAYSSTNGMVEISVIEIQDAPVALDDSASVREDRTVVISVLDNDTDADGDALTVINITSEPAYGDVTINADGTITYDADNNKTGIHTFVYEVSDGNGNTAEATVSVRVRSKPSGGGSNNTDDSDDTVTIDNESTPQGGFGGDDFIIEDLLTPLGAIEFYEPYIKGYPNGMFRANKSVTRAEMAAIFSRILKLDTTVETQTFVDVTENHWAAGYIESVAKLGVFKGYPDGTFKPEEPISRAEFATVIAKYWAYKGIFVSNAATTLIDIDSHWATNYMNQAFNAGLITGYTDSTFRPDEPTMRMHAVTMINKLIARPAYDKETATFPDMPKHHWAFGDVEAASTFFQKESEEEGEMTLE